MYNKWDACQQEGIGNCQGCEPSLGVSSIGILVLNEIDSIPGNGGGVVDTDGLLRVNLESGLLELLQDPVEGHGSIGSGEDVLVHEHTPDEMPGIYDWTSKSVQFN
eukprot:gene20576-biopygen6811